MTKFTSLLIAATAIASMVGIATPGAARDWHRGDRCDWVSDGRGNHGLQHRGQLQQFHFGNFGFGWYQRQLPPGQIRQALRRQGFHRIRDIELRRGVYRAVALGRTGGPVELFVDPFTGRVLCADRIENRGRGYRDTRRHRGYEDRHDRAPAVAGPARRDHRETNRDATSASLLELGRYIRTVGDPNNNPALRRQFAPDSRSSIPDSIARQAALAYDAHVARQREAAAPRDGRGDDRDVARNRDRRGDRDRNRYRYRR